jgi:metal-sulfur cluster biosynthetic enzyme
MSIDAEKVRTALATCLDPEVGLDIVSLGLIYDIATTDTSVAITMTLTTPGCPLVPYFEQEIVAKVKAATTAETVTIELSFDPPWDPGKMTAEARAQLTMMR